MEIWNSILNKRNWFCKTQFVWWLYLIIVTKSVKIIENEYSWSNPGSWFVVSGSSCFSSVLCICLCACVRAYVCEHLFLFMIWCHCPPPLSFYIGGSYKKIGYYDSTKGNLSWFGNDKWIGEPHLSFSSLLYFPLHHCPLHSLSFPLSLHLSLLLFFPFPVFHLSCLGHLL